MAYNKVELDGSTIIDISDTTAETTDVVSGKTFYDKKGDKKTGSVTVGSNLPITSKTGNIPNGYYSGKTYEVQAVSGNSNWSIPSNNYVSDDSTHITSYYFNISPTVTVSTAGWVNSGDIQPKPGGYTTGGSERLVYIKEGQAIVNSDATAATVGGSNSWLSTSADGSSYKVTVKANPSVVNSGWVESINGTPTKDYYIQVETKTATISGSDQNITPTAGKLMEKVVVKTKEATITPNVSLVGNEINPGNVYNSYISVEGNGGYNVTTAGWTATGSNSTVGYATIPNAGVNGINLPRVYSNLPNTSTTITPSVNNKVYGYLEYFDSSASTFKDYTGYIHGGSINVTFSNISDINTSYIRSFSNNQWIYTPKQVTQILDYILPDVYIFGYQGTMTQKTGNFQAAAIYDGGSSESKVYFELATSGYYLAGGSYLYGTYSNLASAIGLTASKIVTGNTILGIAGTGGGSTLITKTITTNGTYNASDDKADGYSQVTVNVAGPTYSTASRAAAAQVLSGYYFYYPNSASTVTRTAGSMTNRGAVSRTLTVNGSSYTIPAGYHNGSGHVYVSIPVYDGSVISPVTDLTGTTWVFNDSVNVDSVIGYTDVYYRINYTDGLSNSWDRLYLDNSKGLAIRYVDDDGKYSEEVYSGYWNAPGYKTVTFTSGTDVTNPQLIEILQANAVQQ